MRQWVVMVLILGLAALPCHAGLSTDFMPVEEELVKKEQPKEKTLDVPAEQAAQPEEKKTNWLLWGLAGAVLLGGVAALAAGGGGGGGGGGSTPPQTGSVSASW